MSTHPPTSGNILVIDADSNIRELLEVNLSSDGFSVATCVSPEQALPIDPEVVKLIIIDAMDDPDFNGIDFIAQTKDDPETEHIGIFLCTASSRSQSIIIDALDAGADDVIAKPFSLRELLARVKSYMRRHHKAVSPREASSLSINVKDINIDLRTHTITKSGMPLALSKTESQILELLARNINLYVSRAEILSTIWQGDTGANDRVVDTNISRLRKKMGDAGVALVNRSGIGYMLSDK